MASGTLNSRQSDDGKVEEQSRRGDDTCFLHVELVCAPVGSVHDPTYSRNSELSADNSSCDL